VSQHNPSAHADLVGAVLGDHTSAINSWYYQKYGRRRFVASLTEWGWYGPPEHGRNGCILESDVARSLSGAMRAQFSPAVQSHSELP
jgi:hypothetical protein